MALGATLMMSASALAAAPDGAGPWADAVVAADQGLRADGSPVLPGRSDPNAALGIAERPAVPANAPAGTYFSLGFGGEIELSFDNRICNQAGSDLDIELVEVTQEPYADELVDVYVSKDGASYTLAAANVSKDATIDLPDEIAYAQFVKIVDVTPIEDAPREDADGYDLDGVQALAPSSLCEDPPEEPDFKGKLLGGGWTEAFSGAKVTHAVKIYCQEGDKKDHFIAHWKTVEYKTEKYKKYYYVKKHGKYVKVWEYAYKTVKYYKNHSFFLKDVETRACSDDPAIDAAPPASSFDTVTGTGNGWLDGKSGATIEFKFNDAGEPGRNDVAAFTIKNSSGETVLQVNDKICGNHQALDFSV